LDFLKLKLRAKKSCFLVSLYTYSFNSFKLIGYFLWLLFFSLIWNTVG
jgi:hypothetical protein